MSESLLRCVEEGARFFSEDGPQAVSHRVKTRSKKAALGQARQGIRILNSANGRVPGSHNVGSPTSLDVRHCLDELGCKWAPDWEKHAFYLDWLRRQWKLHLPAREALEYLAREYERTGRLDLMCHCAPAPCHAEVVRDAILKIVKKGGKKGT